MIAQGLLSVFLTLVATLQVASASPMLQPEPFPSDNSSLLLPSLYGRNPSSSLRRSNSVLSNLRTKGARVPRNCAQAKVKNDPSAGELVGFGFTKSSNGKTAKEQGQLSDFFLVRPSNQDYQDLVLYQKPVLPTQNPIADSEGFWKCVVYGDEDQIAKNKPEKSRLDEKPSKSLPPKSVVFYQDQHQGINDKVMQMSELLAMQWRLRAICSPSYCEEFLINNKPLPNWDTL
ncbi:hypothetical protein DFH05DRAFT_1455394 [Lentinula detonsa]|uniref:Uncharacterized protein n=1 Tax=Lentinula detonsa TaxID=2804962 RepID=A0A9W8PB32_9AGAR|nr:hypothetical protein DFH05DRAFT_1455394 [Lentinula detonsa]